jgi:hypothetical protein
MAIKEYTSNVFINCPFEFDGAYKDIFDAIVFAVFCCGFRARCAKEEEDCSEVRIETIFRIISQCKYGIHDISRTELCEKNNLPRFNMPLELGIFLGAKKYGTREQKKKTCLIMDKKEHRYQKFISDISGQDIKHHDRKPENVIRLVTNWLRNASKQTTIPGGLSVVEKYKIFKKELPEKCKSQKINVDELRFNDYSMLVSEWIKAN